MDAYAEVADALDTPPKSRARLTLARRLADIVCLPASRIPPAERYLAGDLLIELLRESDLELRTRCARRIAALSEAPTMIVRFLARDVISVATPILEDSEALRDSDLVYVARAGTVEHRLLIAGRRVVSELVADAVAEAAELEVFLALLRNREAVLSQAVIDRMVADSRDDSRLCAPLSKRPELRPGHGLAMFWWANEDTRRHLLNRFGAERTTLQEAVSDVFGMAAEESWSDPLARRALQFIERRQRNRAAIEKSPFDGLEDAIEHAAREMSRNTVEEIAYLAGVKPATGAKLLSDPGAEPIPILCKATGLKRRSLDLLWTALRRPMETDGELDPTYARCIEVFEATSTEKAQTILRYWNWALTSAMSPTLAARLEDGDDTGHARQDLSVPELTSRLVFGRRP